MENRGECEGLGAQSRDSSTSALPTHGHPELRDIIIPYNETACAFPENEKLARVSDDVVGSDGVNPGELRGGGEA